MSLIKCCVCRRRISENADICPQCGDPDPQQVSYLISKIIKAFRECQCPVGRASMDEVCFDHERYALFENVCEHLTDRAIVQFKLLEGMWLIARLRNYIPMRLRWKKIRHAELIVSEHNHMIFSLTGYFFEGGYALSDEQFKSLKPNFLTIVPTHPYYQKVPIVRKPVPDFALLDEALLKL